MLSKVIALSERARRSGPDLIWHALALLVPKIKREALIEVGKAEGTFFSVEPSYVARVGAEQYKHLPDKLQQLCGDYVVPEFFSVVLEDIVLIGPFGLPVTRSGRIVLEPISLRWLPTVLKETARELGVSRLLLEYLRCVFPALWGHRRAPSIEFAAHLYCRAAAWPTGGPVFAHWFGEQMPQLRGIFRISESVGELPTVLLNPRPNRWQYHSLLAAGVPLSAIREVTEPSVRVERLVVTSLRNVHSTGMEFDPRARRWVRDLLSADHPRHSGSTRLAVLRQSQESRRPSNLFEVEKVLKKFDVDIVPDGSEFAVSLKTFRNAETIIGVSGSGLFNALFSPGAKNLVEIVAPDFSNRTVFFFLAAELGLDYHRVPSVSLKMPRAVPGDLLVDTQSLERVLATKFR